MAALRRPLEFAARDEGRHLHKVSRLEATIAGACDAVLAHRLPSDFRRAIEGLRGAFAEPLELDERIARVRVARQWLAPFEAPDWPAQFLARPLSVLPGVGPKRAEALARRGLARIDDLLFHLPHRYDDRRALSRVGELEVGRRATFMAEVIVADYTTKRQGERSRRVFQAVVGDGSGTVNLKWFRATDTLSKQITKGKWLLVTGDVKRYRFTKELVHPETELIDPPGDGPAGEERATQDPGDHTRGATHTPGDATRSASSEPGEVKSIGDALRAIVPDYPVPEGVNGRTLRRLVAQVVDEYADLVQGFLPEATVQRLGLPSAAEALVEVHRPDPESLVDEYRERVSPAHARLVLEELYLLELGLALRRGDQATLCGVPIARDAGLERDAADSLPFALTGAQARVIEEIRGDLAQAHPMNRLVQGDVGSGKTAVALLAAVGVARAGHQAALMAPTELLAEQHARTIRSLVEGGGTGLRDLRVARLTASMPKATADSVRARLAAGEIDLVVGTHALVQEDVAFKSLGLAIIDEQHRFGVRQRAALASRNPDGRHPHALVMTATPIPRTLALTLYGDLEVSMIDELPPGRTPVETLLLREGEGRRLTNLVRATVDRGEQVYVVYPLVEESEKSDLRSAIESATRIQSAFRDVRVDLVHGRLDAAARGAAMDAFIGGDTRILVSTTVIEVGVDVPNATLMVIEHAERFGLAQLHQLRGRVGRGERPGTCVLVARSSGEKSEARFRAMLETQSGFDIADADLRLRGPGEFLGTRQSGHLPDLRIADLIRDVSHVETARRVAVDTVRSDPGLEADAELRQAVLARWGDRLALVGVG
jgi:ATP-dependent DNA helicase RecG